VKILVPDLTQPLEYSSIDRFNYTMTGIPGLDDLLDGKGIPEGSSVSIIGAPGAGKTTLAMQFLANGMHMFGEAGIYVSLDEDLTSLRRAMSVIGIDIETLIGKGLTLIDATHLRTLPKEVKVANQRLTKGEFTLLSLTESIRTRVEETKAKRIVIDPLAMFTIIFPDETERRVAVADLIHDLSKFGATTLLLTELQNDGLNRSYQIEDYLSQGVILMRKILRDDNIFYVMRIEKMRSIEHEIKPRLYRVEKGGIKVLSEESLRGVLKEGIVDISKSL